MAVVARKIRMPECVCLGVRTWVHSVKASANHTACFFFFASSTRHVNREQENEKEAGEGEVWPVVTQTCRYPCQQSRTAGCRYRLSSPLTANDVLTSATPPTHTHITTALQLPCLKHLHAEKTMSMVVGREVWVGEGGEGGCCIPHTSNNSP